MLNNAQNQNITYTQKVVDVKVVKMSLKVINKSLIFKVIDKSLIAICRNKSLKTIETPPRDCQQIVGLRSFLRNSLTSR